MKLTIGFSPCPNDTFIFDALVNNKIDTGDLSFDVVLEDVETLNEWALEGKLDITKLSYGVLPLVLDDYLLLNSGSALGTGVGPLLISNKEHEIWNVEGSTIAIPGNHTTAHLLLSLAYPNAKNKIFLRYDKIEDYVLQSVSEVPQSGGDLEGAERLGVIIHENRFTYQARGLHKITDLGAYWESETGNPVPLGGIVIKRSVDAAVALQVDNMIRESIVYAFKHHYTELTGYVKMHAQEMSEDVMRRHIDLYVNNYSIDLGATGRNAVQELLNIYQKINKKKIANNKNIFLSPSQSQ